MPGSADATGLRGRGGEGERRSGRRAAVTRWLRVAAWGLLPILVVFLLTACTSSDPMNTIDVRSDFNQKIFNLYALVFWMAAGVFIVVEGILLYSLIRFRRRPGDGLPPQIHGNNKLEIVWTIIPVILLIIVAVPTLKTIIETETVPAPGPNVVQIHVIGHQWWWEVQYPDYKITTANDIVVPEGKIASFTLTSGDVQHSFWIPKMGGKMDVLPTRTNHMSFTPEDTGEYWGQCVELCGTSHANMRTRLIVLSQADFDNWVKQQQAGPAQPTTDQEKAGEALFMRSACIGCHTINGTNAKGVAGPNLTHVGSRDVIAAGVLQNTPENMAKWISDPAAIKPGIDPNARKGYFMPAFKDQLTPDQIAQIVAYWQSLKEATTRMAGTPRGAAPGGAGQQWRRGMATVTQTPVTTLRRPVEKPTGLWSWFTTVDHKRIGLLYGVSAIVFFIIGGIEALIMRLQLMRPNGTVVSAETFNSLFTMHGTTMIFLVVMPLSVAFFNYIVPLQIGARDVAFPRLNAFSYWVFILGGLILNSSWLLGQAPAMGWFAYAPLTEKAFNLDHSVDFWIIGIQILGIATIAGGLNFFVTIINLRAPGMSLMRMPIFCWMTLITNVLMLLAFPVLTVALFELLFDRYFATKFFEPAAGGDPLLWQHLFWIFGHPEVYILILPAMGIVSEVIPVFSRKPLFGYPAMVLAAAAIAFLAAGVWAHHMFTTGIGPIASSFFALSTMLIAVPTGVKVFNWLATLYGGSIDPKPPLLFAVGFVAMFVIGGLSGVMHASPPIDTQHQDTYFVVAHFHYVLFGGSMFGLFAGLHYWFPKFTGRLLNETLGKWTFWLMLIGFNVTFFPMHFVGVDGMPRRIYTYPEGMGWDFWNFVETIGSWILAFSVLIFLINAFRSWRFGEVAGNDPWDGATLEWSIPGPPPSFNFAQIPRVTARDAFWVEKRATQAAAEVGLAPKAQTAVAVVDDPVALGIHMPNPSYYPLVTAIGVSLILGGFLLSPYMLFGFVPVVSLIGIVVTLAGIYGWSYEPVG